MSAEPHSCTENECTGESFDGEYLRCSFCHEKIFIECLNKCKDTSELLHKLNYVDENRQPVLVNSKIIMQRLKMYFATKSAIGLTCYTCREYFVTTKAQLDSETVKNDKLKINIDKKKKEIQHLSSEVAKLKEQIDQLTSEKNENSGTSDSHVIDPNLLAKTVKKLGEKIIVSVQNELKKEIETIQSGETDPQHSDAVVYSIHVSKFPLDMTPDGIIAYITSKDGNLKADSFQVHLLPNGKRKKTPRQHLSFKISTLNRSVYDQILNNNLWAPEFTARVFQKEKTTQKLHRFGWKNQNNQHTNQNGRNKSSFSKPMRRNNTENKRPQQYHQRRNGNFQRSRRNYERFDERRRNYRHEANYGNSNQNNNYRNSQNTGQVSNNGQQFAEYSAPPHAYANNVAQFNQMMQPPQQSSSFLPQHWNDPRYYHHFNHHQPQFHQSIPPLAFNNIAPQRF